MTITCTTGDRRLPFAGATNFRDLGYSMTPVTEAGFDPFDRAGALERRKGERLLRTMYGHLLEHSGRVVGTMFGSLAAHTGVPAVFHCRAGKDRTGVVVALLLEALGVGRETVLDDQFGGIEAYLLGPAGLDADTLARLRHRLVAPAGAAG